MPPGVTLCRFRQVAGCRCVARCHRVPTHTRTVDHPWITHAGSRLAATNAPLRACTRGRDAVPTHHAHPRPPRTTRRGTPYTTAARKPARRTWPRRTIRGHLTRRVAARQTGPYRPPMTVRAIHSRPPRYVRRPAGLQPWCCGAKRGTATSVVSSAGGACGLGTYVAESWTRASLGLRSPSPRVLENRFPAAPTALPGPLQALRLLCPPPSRVCGGEGDDLARGRRSIQNTFTVWPSNTGTHQPHFRKGVGVTPESLR
jgi:hypothetical protein